MSPDGEGMLASCIVQLTVAIRSLAQEVHLLNEALGEGGDEPSLADENPR